MRYKTNWGQKFPIFTIRDAKHALSILYSCGGIKWRNNEKTSSFFPTYFFNYSTKKIFNWLKSSRSWVLPWYTNSLVLPTFVTKVMENLCSGWFFLKTNSDYLASHFWPIFKNVFQKVVFSWAEIWKDISPVIIFCDLFRSIKAYEEI